MKSLLFLFLLFGSVLTGGAQTVIDLNTGTVESAKVHPSLHPNPFNKARIMERDKAMAQEDARIYGECLQSAFQYLALDSLGKAQRKFEEALRLQPKAAGNYLIHDQLGRIFFTRNQPKDAVRAFSEALRLHPEATETRRLRANAYSAMNHWGQVVEDCSTVLAQTAPADTAQRHEMLLLRTDAYKHLQAYDKAEADLRAILAFTPYDVQAHLLTAIMEEEQGRVDEAMLRLSMLKERHPRLVLARLLHAQMAMAQKDYDVALNDYNEALEITPDDGTLYVQRAALYFALDRPHAATADLNKARQLGCSESVIASARPHKK